MGRGDISDESNTPMSERLVIQHMAPLHAADLSLRDLTIFVGPQATGKSLAAQILHRMRHLEETAADHGEDTSSPETYVSRELQHWLGPAAAALPPGASVCWYPASPPDGAEQCLWWDDTGQLHLNDTLAERVRQSMAQHPRHTNGATIYIPAGRVVYSYISPAYSEPSIPLWRGAGVLRACYGELDNAIATLHAIQQGRDNGQEYTTSAPPEVAIFLLQRMRALLKGDLRYGWEGVWLDTGHTTIDTPNFAAGQMAIWPLCAIIEQAFLETGSLQQLIVEEPEAHLHPAAQVQVMEMIAMLVRQGVRVLLTTHSPYVLYAIDNFLMAQKVLDSGSMLLTKDQQNVALSAEQVAAYRFTSQDGVSDIMDREVNLIHADELEQVAENLGAEFTHFQDMLLEQMVAEEASTGVE